MGVREDIMKSGLCKLRVVIFLIIAVLVTGSAWAGVVDQTNVTDYMTITAGTSIGQTFTAIDTSTIETISFYFLDNYVGSLGTIGIDVYSGEGYGGNQLGSGTFALSAGAFGPQAFDFSSSGIDIVQGNIYSIRLTPSTSRWAVGKNQIVDIYGINNGFDYNGGDAIINGQMNTNNDLAFQVASTPVVPEPLSSVLFVIGASVLVGRYIKRKKTSV
jgi:hypothetical protein